MALWLVPSGAVGQRLAAIVERLARRYGTPRFHPHVTLLGGVGASDSTLEGAEEIASAAQPFDLTLARPVARAELYRAVVVEAAPCLDLLRLHHLAREVFGRLEDPAPFEPHLSLMYGTLPPEARSEVLAELPDVRVRFTVDAIAVWSTEGLPEAWFEVGRFPLAAGRLRPHNHP